MPFALLPYRIRGFVLAGQTNPSGSDTEKVSKLLRHPLIKSHPVATELCDGLRQTLHAVIPPPADAIRHGDSPDPSAESVFVDK